MAYDDQNIFAKILRGEVPSYQVAEDAHCVAFMDVMPQSRGHALVIPRAPAENVYDVDSDSLQQVIVMTQRVAVAAKQVFQPAGVMIAQLNESGAGQTVFHLHFHVIPRYAGIDLAFHARGMEDAAVLEQHAAEMRDALGLAS